MPLQETIPAGIALGSNEGNRLLNLKEARARIMMLPEACHPSTPRCLSAPVYETEPVDCPLGAGSFLNTVIELAFRSPFSPLVLLASLREIENALGRPSRRPRNTPRSIDLDILYAGQWQVDTPELTLPHPRLSQRRFVLEPLAAIRPGLVLPGETRAVSEILRDLDHQQKVTLYATRW